MPHQCTACEELLPNGSRDMLGGCPECGGNRFQYLPADFEPNDTSEPEETDSSGGRLIVATECDEPSKRASNRSGESPAQADARTSVVDPRDLPKHEPREEPLPEPEPPSPSADDLRSELENTFGSIRIVDRGEYELNLLELYERDACIIQLEEDGRYVIDVPELFNG